MQNLCNEFIIHAFAIITHIYQRTWERGWRWNINL